MKQSSRRKRKRRAALLVETAAAGLLLGMAMVMTVKMLGWIAAERRSAERRGWAVQEAANAMEQLAAMPFDGLSTSTARASARLSAPAVAVLPEGEIDLTVTEDAAMKRIDLAVSWKGASGRSEAPVRLTAWVARKGAGR